MSELFFLQTTVVLTIVSFVLAIALLSLWLFMKDEGRFFFKRSFGNKGIDVIRHEPLSNRLRLITVQWTGQYFKYGKEMMFFGIEKLINPKTEPQKYFNEVMSRMCTWAGSKRPVLIATDTVSHIANPDLLALAARAKNYNKYELVKSHVKDMMDFLAGIKDEKITTITHLETLRPEDLTEFMEDISARDAYQAYNLGKRVNELERSKGIDLGSAGKIVISFAAIGIVVIVAYLIASGQLQEMINNLRV